MIRGGRWTIEAARPRLTALLVRLVLLHREHPVHRSPSKRSRGRRRLRAPERAAFEGRGTAEAREFLVALIAEFDEGDPLRERARREVERLIGEPIGRVPAEERAKLEWLQGLLTRGERAARRGAALDALEAGR